VKKHRNFSFSKIIPQYCHIYIFSHLCYAEKKQQEESLMKLGMVTDSLAHLPLQEAAVVCRKLGLEQVELGCGNWSPAPHIDLNILTADAGKRAELLDTLARIKQIGAYIRTATSNQTLSYVGGILLLLMLLVWLCNGTLPKTLSDLGITFLVAGLLLSAANLAVDSGLLGGILPIPAGVWGVIRGVLSAIAAVHYTIMIAGGSLIVLAIAAKIIKTSIQKKKAAAAA
jgi:hypothetical protein